jgi:hypothetical protein
MTCWSTLWILTVWSETNGAGPNSCADGIDNGGTGDGIDLLDPDCQSCNDGVDNDLDGLLDGRDPDCLGLDIDNDGVPDQRILDYSPPRFPGGRANVLPNLIETNFMEAHALIAIDLNGDGLQDAPTDPINMIVFKPRNAPGGQETAARVRSAALGDRRPAGGRDVATGGQ